MLFMLAYISLTGCGEQAHNNLLYTGKLLAELLIKRAKFSHRAFLISDKSARLL